MFTYNRGDVPFYSSGVLQARHGFSTRFGGVSSLDYTASLNLGFGRGDSDETVRENLRSFVGAVACHGENGAECHSHGENGAECHSHGKNDTECHDIPYVTMSQVHGTDIVYVDYGKIAGSSIADRFTCDGLVTDIPGVCLIARSADCVPVLLEYCEHENSVPAVVAAVHAGWRGTVADIMASAVAAMVRLGAKPQGIHAAIGPCIHRCHFEIGGEVAAEFVRAGLSECVFKRNGIGCNGSVNRESVAESFTPITQSIDRDGKYYADLVLANTQNLIRAGVMPHNIDALDKCTMCRPDEFYSHRATNGKRGTLGAGIML